MVVTAAAVTAPAVLLIIFSLFVASLFMVTDLRITAQLRYQEICGTMQKTSINACCQ